MYIYIYIYIHIYIKEKKKEMKEKFLDFSYISFCVDKRNFSADFLIIILS